MKTHSNRLKRKKKSDNRTVPIMIFVFTIQSEVKTYIIEYGYQGLMQQSFQMKTYLNQ